MTSDERHAWRRNRQICSCISRRLSQKLNLVQLARQGKARCCDCRRLSFTACCVAQLVIKITLKCIISLIYEENNHLIITKGTTCRMPFLAMPQGLHFHKSTVFTHRWCELTTMHLKIPGRPRRKSNRREGMRALVVPAIFRDVLLNYGKLQKNQHFFKNSLMQSVSVLEM